MQKTRTFYKLKVYLKETTLNNNQKIYQNKDKPVLQAAERAVLIHQKENNLKMNLQKVPLIYCANKTA